MRRYSGEPNYSCPELDAAISHIENARTINDTLREQNRAYDVQLDAAQNAIAVLEAENMRLHAELEDALDALARHAPTVNVAA